MKHDRDSTKARSVEYELEYPVYDDLIEMISVTAELDAGKTEEVRKALKPFTAILKPLESVVNAAAKQNATQGSKDLVRKAVDAAKKAGVPTERLAKDDGVVKAIAEQQKRSRRYNLGPARGTGMTKAQAGKAGVSLREVMGEEKFKKLMAEHGLSEKDLS